MSVGGMVDRGETLCVRALFGLELPTAAATGTDATEGMVSDLPSLLEAIRGVLAEDDTVFLLLLGSPGGKLAFSLKKIVSGFILMQPTALAVKYNVTTRIPLVNDDIGNISVSSFNGTPSDRVL
jgi:hypothetical protein